MTMTAHSSTISSAELRSSLDLVEIKPGVKFSLTTLRALLPDVETLLFFAKVYELDYRQLSALMAQVLQSDLARALFTEGHEHSNDLQGYLIGGYVHDNDCPSNYEDDEACECAPAWQDGIVPPAQRGDVNLSPLVPTGEILPEVWRTLEVEVAQSIKDVASKLESVVAMMPGKQGQMVFSSMAKLNAKRPTIGDYRASIHHAPQKQNLLILDVSGSMNEHTVQRIVDDVVALSYTANAHLAVVSNTTTWWEPGTYSVDDVLRAAEFGGTFYETLAPLFDEDWGTVITVADYDSSMDAKRVLKKCVGRIDQVLDVSLVNRPTFLAECVGQLASEVRPILVGSSPYVLS